MAGSSLSRPIRGRIEGPGPRILLGSAPTGTEARDGIVMAELGAPHLLVVDRMSARGGQELALHEYATLLAERAPCVAVLPFHPGSLPPKGGYEVLAAPEGSRRARDEALRRLTQKKRADGWVVQAFAPIPGAQLYIPRGGLVREALERRAVSQGSSLRGWISRHSYPHSPNKARLLRGERELFAAPGPLHVVALSRYVAAQLARHYDHPDELVHRVANGISLARLEGAQRRREEWRRRLGVAPETVLFVTAAQNFRLKGGANARERGRAARSRPALARGGRGGGGGRRGRR